MAKHIGTYSHWKCDSCNSTTHEKPWACPCCGEETCEDCFDRFALCKGCSMILNDSDLKIYEDMLDE